MTKRVLCDVCLALGVFDVPGRILDKEVVVPNQGVQRRQSG